MMSESQYTTITSSDVRNFIGPLLFNGSTVVHLVNYKNSVTENVRQTYFLVAKSLWLFC